MSSRDEAIEAAAPIVDRVLKAIALERGCSVHELDALLCAAIESAVLDGMIATEDRKTPLAIDYEEKVDVTQVGFKLRVPKLPDGVAGRKSRS